MRRQFFLKTTVLLLSVLVLAGTSVWAQEMDYNLDQYAEYQRVISIEDPVQRAEEILTFMSEHQGLSLVQYALKNYGDLLEQFRTGDQFDDYLKYAEKLIAARPDDTELAKGLIRVMALSAYEIQNYEEAIKHGERAYELTPAPNLAFVLANSYQKGNDEANFVKYGEIAMKELEPAHTIEIATWLRASATKKGNLRKAATYARAVIGSLNAMSQPANVSEADWRKYTQNERFVSQLIIARSLYEAEKFKDAVKQFEQITGSRATRAFKGEAYYYIGMSHWKQGAMDPAMRAFALGSALKTGHSEACQTYLERLYMSTHNGSLAGLDELVARITRSE